MPGRTINPGFLASRAVPLERDEKKAAALYASLSAIRNDKAAKRREQQTRRRAVCCCHHLRRYRCRPPPPPQSPPAKTPWEALCQGRRRAQLVAKAKGIRALTAGPPRKRLHCRESCEAGVSRRGSALHFLMPACPRGDAGAGEEECGGGGVAGGVQQGGAQEALRREGAGGGPPRKKGPHRRRLSGRRPARWQHRRPGLSGPDLQCVAKFGVLCTLPAQLMAPKSNKPCSTNDPARSRLHNCYAPKSN